METVLKIQDKGKKEGTSKWAKEFLENGELYISRTNFKEPCIIFKAKENSDPEILCKIPNEIERIEQHWGWNEYGRCFVCDPAEENPNKRALFGILTPSAYDSVWDFLKRCCNVLEEYWDADKEEEINVELTNI